MNINFFVIVIEVLYLKGPGDERHFGNITRETKTLVVIRFFPCMHILTRHLLWELTAYFTVGTS